MNYKMTKIAAALALTLTAVGSQAAIVGPTDMRITAGTFGASFFTNGVSNPIDIVNSSLDISDQYNLPGWDTTTSQPLGVQALGATLSFDFGTGPTDQVNVFFAPTAPRTIGGGAAPVFSGSLVNGNVSSISMLSMFFNWNGYTSNQGNAVTSLSDANNGVTAPVTNLTMSDCVAGISCNWTMSWRSVLVGGPFNGPVGTWNLSGTIAAVPEASTYGMMLAGLGLVGFAARRRQRRIKR